MNEHEAPVQAHLENPMVTCHHIHDRASAFHDGDLSDAEREAYRAHLEACPHCSNFYRSFEALIDRARDAVRAEPPPGLAEAMVSSFRHRSKTA